MFGNYIAPTFTRIARTPFTTAANILTLALGLACFLAAWGIATYWRSADGYHSNANRTFLVGQSNTAKGQAANPLTSTSSWTMPRYLKQDFPEIQHIARAVQAKDVAVAAGANKLLLNQGTVDPDFLNIFDLDFIAGDPRNALSAPDSLVLTQDAANRLFGAASAMGRTVLVNGVKELTVTGVIAPVRQPSFMGSDADAVYRFDMLRNWASNKETADLDRFDSWIGLMPFTFIVLPQDTSVDAFNARLPGFLDRRVPASDKAAAVTIMRAMPVSDLTTFNLDRTLFSKSGVKSSAIAALLALAALTLVIACINYANLATAQAASRAKEIGMRRTLGAGALRVMGQAWFESTILTACATAVAVLVLALAAPVIKASTSIDLLYFLSGGPEGLALVAGLVAIVAFVAGAYPALVLSSVRPAAALRSGRSRSGSRLVTRILVAVQFASASFLLILVTVTQLQRGHLEQTVLAPREDPVAVLNDLVRTGIDYDTLATRLSTQAGIKVVSVTDIPPWSSLYNGMTFARTADPAAASSMTLVKGVGYDYFDAFNLKVLAGRQFDRARDTRPVSLYLPGGPAVPEMVIDQRQSENLGFETPQAAVGQIVYIPAAMMRGTAKAVRIIGVTEAETTALEPSGGVVYTYMPRGRWGEQRPIVRIDRDQLPAAIAAINRVFGELAPNIPAQIRFFDQQFEQTYRQYGRISQLFILLASTAFIIASIGLLGIAVHVASKRRHEIAIRKTLGSSASRVVRLLLMDFSQPVLIGNLIAWPLAWLAAETYLSAFANRIDLSPLPFVVSVGVTLAIAWAAIIGVVLRAANLRPAEVLRSA